MHAMYFRSTLEATISFGALLLGPGYLLAKIAKIRGFDLQSKPEQLAWCLVLSNPLAILIAVLLKSTVGSRGVVNIFLLLDVMAIGMSVVARSKQKENAIEQPLSRQQTAPLYIVATLGCLGLYLLAAGLPISTSRGIWEPIASADWSIRVPLINAAMHSRGALLNPFDHVNGSSFPIHYYYYWYTLAGIAGNLLDVPARAVLQAATIWASWTTLSTLFLLTKYLFPLPASVATASSLFPSVLLGLPVLGADILQVAFSFVRHRLLWPEPEWWRAPEALTPSFNTAFLYAPHHCFGFCSGCAGYLVLHLLLKEEKPFTATVASMVRNLVPGLFLGVTLGTSTFLGLFFAAAYGVLIIASIGRHRAHQILLIALTTTSACIVSASPYAQLLLHSSAPSASGRFPIRLALRSWDQLSLWLYREIVLVHHMRKPNLVSFLALRLVLLSLLWFSEAGVLALVLMDKARLWKIEFRTVKMRADWILVLSFLLPCLFVTSDAIIGSNDLGFLTAFALRCFGVIMLAPYLHRFLREKSSRRSTNCSFVGVCFGVFVVLGLLSQTWQIVMQRFGIAIMERVDVIPGPFPSPPELPEQYLAEFQTYQYIERVLPYDAFVLTSPDSTLRSLSLLYSNRGLIAPAPNCMTSFGGDADACKEALPGIRGIFETANLSLSASASNVRAACADQHANAVLVTDHDAVWHDRASWIWNLSPDYAGGRERVFLCSTLKVLH